MYLASDWTEYILWLNYCTNPWNLVKNTWCPDPELLIKKELAADLKINSYKNFAIFLINNDNNGGWDRYTRYFSPFNKCSSICQCTSGKSKTPLLLFFIISTQPAIWKLNDYFSGSFFHEWKERMNMQVIFSSQKCKK